MLFGGTTIATKTGIQKFPIAIRNQEPTGVASVNIVTTCFKPVDEVPDNLVRTVGSDICKLGNNQLETCRYF